MRPMNDMCWCFCDVAVFPDGSASANQLHSAGSCSSLLCLFCFFLGTPTCLFTFSFMEWFDVVPWMLPEINNHVPDWGRWSWSFQGSCKSIIGSPAGKGFGDEHQLSCTANFWSITVYTPSEIWFSWWRKYTALPSWRMAWKGKLND